MRFFSWAKDGGPESTVDAYFICEIKGLFSIAILKFNPGTRPAFHSHAFNALTWFLSGAMVEQDASQREVVYSYHRSVVPKVTLRSKCHRVLAAETSWCFTVRGPWSKTWTEQDLKKGTLTTLGHGRRIISTTRVDDQVAGR